VPRLRSVPRLAWLALVVVLLIGGGLRYDQSVNPVEKVSADAQSYTNIAQNLARNGTYTGRSKRGPVTDKAWRKAKVQALHWPPATPHVFALAYEVTPGADPNDRDEVGLLHTTQFVISTATILVAFVLGWVLAGPWAGVVTAAIVALYPPLVWGPSTLLSEPLGALLVTAAFAAVALAWRSGRLPWWALSGALLGGVLLTRTDLMFVPLFLAVFALCLIGATVGWRRGLQSAGLLIAGTAVVVLPWTFQASRTAETLVPVTTGSGSALFVGTYLPGNGSTFDMKFAMLDEIVERHPSYADRHYTTIPAQVVLDDVAKKTREKHPDLDLERDQALSTAARENLRTYALGQPVAFARMMLFKVGKMWTRYARGGADPTKVAYTAIHLLIVGLAAFGLLWGIVRRRDPALVSILIAIATGTAVHMLAVAHGRYNLPLMPILIAGGVAGWAMLLQGRRAAGADRAAGGPSDADSAPTPPPAPSVPGPTAAAGS
jgi:4-amino-4-deoxy-L-arabinose transferase-like glycosyltransferase